LERHNQTSKAREIVAVFLGVSSSPPSPWSPNGPSA